MNDRRLCIQLMLLPNFVSEGNHQNHLTDHLTMLKARYPSLKWFGDSWCFAGLAIIAFGVFQKL